LNGGTGFSTMTPEDLARFGPIEDIDVPCAAYDLLDIDTGSSTRGIAPAEALAQVSSAGRSPLTIAEGIALVAAHPEVLRKNHCFYLAGSSAGDRRVPALWLSGGRPRLGWCWAGNPHTWLGMASCRGRAVCG
jgi:hypothetical protein